ncbi:MAG: precorrin-8X methylmutase [Butyricicoccus sp.]|nr:precorrin-8X methylmutase [Butyricicoccus sp.]
MNPIIKPADIEKRSFEIITEELGGRTFPEGQAEVVKRVIHTSADFDYADNLIFSPGVIEQAKEALRQGATIVTDTNMALAGVSKTTLAKFGGKAICFMADEQVAKEAKERGVTRAVVSMEHAAKLEGPVIFAIGNAPTALIRLHEMIEAGEIAPALVIGVPVGFVNVVESKELFVGSKTPHIIARGRKGGSNVAAAICNALLYQLYTREGFEK